MPSKTKPYRCGCPCDCLIDPLAPQPLDVVSYGGGTQSTALMVLAAQGRIPFTRFLFCNVGADSENPATLRFIDEYAVPYAAEHGLDLQQLHRVKRDGSSPTIWEDANQPETRSINIPARMANGAPGNRSCTADWKIKVIARWTRAHGATKDNPARVAVGFSQDEIARVNGRQRIPHELPVYPLIGVGINTGLALRRDDCERIIREAGLPQPGKSSCFFCPFQRPSTWADQARTHPELFDKSCDLEDTLNATRARIGKDPVFLTRFGIPLREAIDTDQPLLTGFDDLDGSCDSGYCFT